MKKSLLSAFCLALLSIGAKATIHVVQVANFQFTPANVPNVLVGDTMRWQWVSGEHTTTNDPATQSGNALPAGAATWNAPMDAGNPTFDYKVTVAGSYNYWCIPHSPRMAATFTASDILPVKLTAFAVSAGNGKAVLNWKTLTEQNTDYFSVRRSANGINYNEIAKIPASGNSDNARSYSFTDDKISAGKYYYYNLAIVDKDGRKEFSEIKMFKGKDAITKLILNVSPNPISRPGHLMMSFNANKDGQMNVSVINSEGKAIIKTQMQAYKGVNSGHVHLGDLPAGSYTLVCQLDGVKEAYKIIFK